MFYINIIIMKSKKHQPITNVFSKERKTLNDKEVKNLNGLIEECNN